MSPTTLFKVYMSVVSRREGESDARGTSFGIAVKDDVYALRWQRLDRLAKKLETRLLHDLLKYESYEWRNRADAARHQWYPLD
ncbi:MAG: hypothetical protein M0R06_12280 [Sphaerochaeta sp.]|nr:hypothetical protein [Sphaerochaeta sp.]